jgi:hypothetical protein
MLAGITESESYRIIQDMQQAIKQHILTKDLILNIIIFMDDHEIWQIKKINCKWQHVK